ncbi:MAG TPA: alginate lyase family protein [Chitinophagaceae bacterium]|nr:alginate lyase family protein [Chitinophagaceae bacterium]
MNIRLLICVISGVLVAAAAAGQSGKPRVFALQAQSLESNKARIAKKDPAIMPAYEQLLKDAEKALQFGPVSVMEKKHFPPSGNKHDYMSLAPYHWPDSSKKDGLPYIRKDGQTNPEVREYKDKEYMPPLCEAVHTLALAYYFSGNDKYASHAAKLLRVWFLDTATKMNPNLNFAQAIKGVNTGRGAGLIDSRHFIKVVDAIGLLCNSASWRPQDTKGMQQWFAEFLHWMQTSPNGRDEMDAPNNHGGWYDAQRLSFALFIDSMELAKKIVMNAADRLDKQMDETGKFPHEMQRTISLHYSVFAMNAFCTIAAMAEKANIEMWDYVSPSGKSIRKGFEQLLPYLLREKQWEGQQIRDFNFEDGFLLLKEGAARYGCTNCEAGIQRVAGDKAKRLRIQLLY